jgi:phosphopantothenate synthetase
LRAINAPLSQRSNVTHRASAQILLAKSPLDSVCAIVQAAPPHERYLSAAASIARSSINIFQKKAGSCRGRSWINYLDHP